MHSGRRRQPGMGLMLLFYQLFGVIGIDQIPPVTLGTIGVQVAVFLRLFKLPWHKPSEICVSAYKVWKRKEYSRLIYAAVEHGDDWHLYYNMVSFAVKGRTLERRFGSIKFLYIISVFTVLTNIVLVALNIFASDYDPNYADHCAVGFSGVIFALKVLTTYYDHNYTSNVMGIPITVPTKYAVWIELVLIQMIYPNASFMGHLAGILVGMAYVLGPLSVPMDVLYSLGKSIISPSVPDVRQSRRFTPRAEASGYRNSDYVPPGMSEDEQMQRAMNESLDQPARNVPPYPDSFSGSSVPPYPDSFSGSSPPPPPPAGFVFDDIPSGPPPAAGIYPDLEELRNRRQARYT